MDERINHRLPLYSASDCWSWTGSCGCHLGDSLPAAGSPTASCPADTQCSGCRSRDTVPAPSPAPVDGCEALAVPLSSAGRKEGWRRIVDRVLGWRQQQELHQRLLANKLTDRFAFCRMSRSQKLWQYPPAEFLGIHSFILLLLAMALLVNTKSHCSLSRTPSCTVGIILERNIVLGRTERERQGNKRH